MVNLTNLCSTRYLFLNLGLLTFCIFMFTGVDAGAGTTGVVDIIKSTNSCRAVDMYFKNSGVSETDGSGRANVTFKPNGDVIARCSYNLQGDQKPETRSENTSFDCNIYIEGAKIRSSNRKATLNTSGKVDITCRTNIDSNGTTDTGKGKGKK